MLIRPAIFTITYIIFCHSVFADVLVTAKDEESGHSEIKLSKNWAKIVNHSEPQQYMLVNMKNNESLIIDNEQKLAVKMDGMGMDIMPPDMLNMENTQPKPKLEFIKKDSGPKIAGYKTTRYQIMANGELCSENFVSKDPLKTPEINAFAKTMEKLSDDETGMNDFFSPCEFAENEFDKNSSKYGMPLLTKDANGIEKFRILEVKTNASFSANEFSTPAGYKVVSAHEMMQQEMEDVMSEMPSEEEMEQMTDQMQQGLQMMEKMMERLEGMADQ